LIVNGLPRQDLPIGRHRDLGLIKLVEMFR
jgi:hypothetical protein